MDRVTVALCLLLLWLDVRIEPGDARACARMPVLGTHACIELPALGNRLGQVERLHRALTQRVRLR